MIKKNILVKFIFNLKTKNAHDLCLKSTSMPKYNLCGQKSSGV